MCFRNQRCRDHCQTHDCSDIKTDSAHNTFLREGVSGTHSLRDIPHCAVRAATGQPPPAEETSAPSTRSRNFVTTRRSSSEDGLRAGERARTTRRNLPLEGSCSTRAGRSPGSRLTSGEARLPRRELTSSGCSFEALIKLERTRASPHRSQSPGGRGFTPLSRTPSRTTMKPALCSTIPHDRLRGTPVVGSPLVPVATGPTSPGWGATADRR